MTTEHATPAGTGAGRLAPVQREAAVAPISLGSDPVVLLADEDDQVRRGLTEHLANYHVTVVHCADGAAALLEAGLHKPDVLLLSARLPVLDGGTVLRLVLQRMDVPVVLGVGPEDADQVASALAAGASACVARPYRPHDVVQLLSLANPERHWDQSLTIGPITLDPSSYEVRVRGAAIERLPLREFQLLRLLMQNADRVVTRDRIRAELWGTDPQRSNTLTVHIRRLRERLGDDPRHPALIQAVRGVGYRLVPPSGDQT